MPAFAKLNHAWFDVKTSCTTVFAVSIFDRFRLHALFEEPWDTWLHVAITIAPVVMTVWEFLIPLLFAVPRCRPTGTIVVLLIHWAFAPIAWDYAQKKLNAAISNAKIPNKHSIREICNIEHCSPFKTTSPFNFCLQITLNLGKYVHTVVCICYALCPRYVRALESSHVDVQPST